MVAGPGLGAGGAERRRDAAGGGADRGDAEEEAVGEISEMGAERSDCSAAWQLQQLIKAAVPANRGEITVGLAARGRNRSDGSAAC